MDPALKAMMGDTINTVLRTGRNADGTPTYGSPALITARVEENERIIRPLKGEAVATSHLLFTEEEITIDHRIWLPGDLTTDLTVARRPIKTTPILNEVGVVEHYETWV